MVQAATLDRAEEQALADELCRRDLVEYVRTCYPDFELSPWQVAMCEALQRWVEAIERAESPRLMIHTIPQGGKTTIVSRAFIAWLVGRHPEWDGIMASYAANLSRKNSRWVRNRLRMDEHQRIFPACRLAQDSQAIEDMSFTTGHQLISRGVGGGGTGNPAMYVVVDDPFRDRAAADSGVQRDNIEDWYHGTAMVRLGPGAGVLIMHTRWHIDDLAGRLLKLAKDGKDDPHVDQWEVLSWPAEWEPGCPREFYQFETVKGVTTGWLRCRFRIQDLRKKRANLPARDWLSLFQQKPQLEGGSILLTKWIQETPWPKGWRPTVYQAWDLAGTKADLKVDDGCYSVGVAIAMDWLRRWWLVDVVRGKWDLGEVSEQILTFGRKWRAQRVWAEDPVALYLESTIQKRMQETGNFIPFQRVSVQGRGDKQARAVGSLQPVMSVGGLFVPAGAVWLNELKVEMGLFPRGTYVDQIDALSLGFAEAMPMGQPSPPPPTSREARDPSRMSWDELAGANDPKTPGKSPWTR